VATTINEEIEKRNAANNPNELEQKVLEALRKKEGASLVDLSNALDVGINTVRNTIASLRIKNFIIDVAEDDDTKIVLGKSLAAPPEPIRIDVQKYFGGRTVRVGLLGESHLGSKYERIDVLNALYDIYAQEGVHTVYHSGNTIDAFKHGINDHEVYKTGIDDQIDNFIEKYPQREGIDTHYITGECHEGWWIKSHNIDIGRLIESKAVAIGRRDLHYIGHLEADIELQYGTGSNILRIIHPGGGTSYAISYQVQKIIESYQGGEKPRVLFVGHFHKAMYLPKYRDVFSFQAGCTQDQTPFMRKKHLEAHVGGWIIDMIMNDAGIVTRVKGEFIAFYDRGFHTKWLR